MNKSKEIYVFDLEGKQLGETFNGVSHVANFFNLKSKGNISRCCKGKLYTYSNMIYILKQDYNKELLKEKLLKAKTRYHKPNARAIIRIDIDTKEEYRYRSVYDADKEGFCRIAINKVCKGKQKIHAGYLWRYEDDRY